MRDQFRDGELGVGDLNNVGMSQVRFFALPEDWPSTLRVIEESAKISAILAGRSTNPIPQRFDKLDHLPNLGTADGDQTVACAGYLVSFADDPIQVRRGATGYFFDQLLNPNAVTFVPAGQWHDNVIIAGTVGNAHDTPSAAKLMRLFRKAISKCFRPIGGVWVGETAFKTWETGGRLTGAVQSPPEFDLIR